MAETPSTMLPLGTEAPSFSLTNVLDDRAVSDRDFDGKPLLVMFVCNHCPFVIHVRQELLRIGRDYEGRMGIVAINANSEMSHPQDGPSHMRELAIREAWPFPFLFDRTQAVAIAYRAACTPDFFLFDTRHTLVYRGQLDDSRPRNGKPVTGKDLRAAIDLVLAGKPVPTTQTPSIGCNIKWAPGNRPDYALAGAHGFFRATEQAEDLVRVGEERLSGGQEPHAARCAFEER
jgi:thiol-disulfide isomerase/thioredoxin